MTTFECLGAPLAWTLTVERILIVVAYYFVTRRWLIAAEQSTGKSQKAWIQMAWIFRLCALCGYGFPALAGKWPTSAYLADAIAMPLLLLACVAFLITSKGLIFFADRRDVLLGQAVADHVPEDLRQKLEDIDAAKILVKRLMTDD